MSFLPGRLVFPGGGVDPRDAGDDLLPDDGDVAGIAGAFAVSTAEARTKVGTAVREMFEETGVLLARDAGAGRDVPAEVLDRERERTLSRDTTVSAVLDRLGRRVCAADLKPWARWVTPAVSPVRFDVTFFFAALPADQAARHLSTEALDTTWWTPAEVLAALAAGTVQLATPQRVLLTELAGLRTLDAAFGSPRDLAPVCPRPALLAGQYYLVFPDGR
jgi:8-oxo-dGTP pyrophosphatase MutT (NUDIX family)